MHKFYTIEDFTLEEIAGKNLLYEVVSSGQKVCKQCGLDDSTTACKNNSLFVATMYALIEKQQESRGIRYNADFTTADSHKYASECALALLVEIGELGSSWPFAPWKTNAFDLKNVKREIIDCFFFLTNINLCFGLTADSLRSGLVHTKSILTFKTIWNTITVLDNHSGIQLEGLPREEQLITLHKCLQALFQEAVLLYDCWPNWRSNNLRTDEILLRTANIYYFLFTVAKVLGIACVDLEEMFYWVLNNNRKRIMNGEHKEVIPCKVPSESDNCPDCDMYPCACELHG